jgi:hypothetical protein
MRVLSRRAAAMSSDATTPGVVQAPPSRVSVDQGTPASSTGQTAANPPAQAPAATSDQTAAGQSPAEQGTTPAQPGAKGRESRKSPRRRVLKEGKVIFGKAQSVVDVTIDNMSEGGAHIRMLSSHGLPGEFYLAEASRGVIHRAEVAWRTATGMGLRLVGPLEDLAAREAFLRKFRRN